MITINNLNLYIPDSAVNIFENYFKDRHLTISLAKTRSSKLGDYKYNSLYKSSQISINNNLSPEAFTVVLAHELAHYEVFTKYKRRVQPHGIEWKNSFTVLLNKLLVANIFHNELREEIIVFAKNPPASFKNRSKIYKILFGETEQTSTGEPLHKLEKGTKFYINNKKNVFIKGEKRKIRFFCSKEGSSKLYLASPNLLVFRVE